MINVWATLISHNESGFEFDEALRLADRALADAEFAAYATPMSIFKRVSNSTTRHGMAILPTGSATIPTPRRRFAMPSHYGRWVAPTMGYALVFAALLGLLRRNPEAVATYSQASADAVSRFDFPGNWAAVFFQGWAKRSEAAEELSLAEMRRSLAIVPERGQVWLLPRFEAALAEAEASAGRSRMFSTG